MRLSVPVHVSPIRFNALMPSQQGFWILPESQDLESYDRQNAVVW
jgi:hypothetical protein